MASNLFRSFKPTAAKIAWTEAQVVDAARQLLEEHAAAREAATLEANRVCGNCRGSGTQESIVMPGSLVTCYACEGTGKPNDKVQSLPALNVEDDERLWKLRQLLVNHPRFAPAVLGVVREYFPDMYADAASDKAPN